MQVQAHIHTQTQPISTRPILKLVPRDTSEQRQDPTLAALAGDPVLQSFYARVLPRGVAPFAGVPFFPCA
jgi:hypothetical protein